MFDVKTLLPLLGPFVMQEFDSVIYPQLLAEIEVISNPLVKELVKSLLPALKDAIDSELKKLSA